MLRRGWERGSFVRASAGLWYHEYQGCRLGVLHSYPQQSVFWVKRVFMFPVVFSIQAYAFDPGADDSQIVTSNGIAWTIGNQ